MQAYRQPISHLKVTFSNNVVRLLLFVSWRVSTFLSMNNKVRILSFLFWNNKQDSETCIYCLTFGPEKQIRISIRYPLFYSLHPVAYIIQIFIGRFFIKGPACRALIFYIQINRSIYHDTSLRSEISQMIKQPVFFTSSFLKTDMVLFKKTFR